MLPVMPPKIITKTNSIAARINNKGIASKTAGGFFRNIFFNKRYVSIKYLNSSKRIAGNDGKWYRDWSGTYDKKMLPPRTSLQKKSSPKRKLMHKNKTLYHNITKLSFSETSQYTLRMSALFDVQSKIKKE